MHPTALGHAVVTGTGVRYYLIPFPHVDVLAFNAYLPDPSDEAFDHVRVGDHGIFDP